MRTIALFTFVLSMHLLSAASVRGQAPAPAPQSPPASAAADAGKKLYVSYGCWQCHGYEGQGGAAGPRLAPPPLPYDAFSRIVRRPPNQMPAYSEKLVPNADLTRIHAYLRSRPAPPPVEKIPALQALQP